MEDSMSRKSPKKRGSQRAALYSLMHKVPEGERMYAILFGLVDPLSQENPAKDRTAAIVGATFLEYALKQAIIRYFKRDNIDRGIDYLFDLDQAPYRGFAGLTRLARALGIIDQSEFDQLEAIRLIRNVFAHTMEDVSFSTPAIADLFDSITIIKDHATVPEWTDPFGLPGIRTIFAERPSRSAFVYAVGCFFWNLITSVNIEPPTLK
jgi:DNA-binding MltR family transcriptional regulator